MLNEPKCYTRQCKHYLGVKWFGDDELSEKNFCQAFPNGIPKEITYGDNQHLVPTPDQNNNIVFEKQQ